MPRLCVSERCPREAWVHIGRPYQWNLSLDPSSAPLAAQNDGFLTQLGVRYMEVVSLYSSL